MTYVPLRTTCSKDLTTICVLTHNEAKSGVKHTRQEDGTKRRGGEGHLEITIYDSCWYWYIFRGLPYMTSAEKGGGGQEMQQICRQTV